MYLNLVKSIQGGLISATFDSYFGILGIQRIFSKNELVVTDDIKIITVKVKSI